MPPTSSSPTSSALASWSIRSSRWRSTAATPSAAPSTSQVDRADSLEPAAGLKKSHIALVADIPPGIVMDSYPGPYGQIVTNLFINALKHGFDGVPEGTIHIEARPVGAGTGRAHLPRRRHGHGGGRAAARLRSVLHDARGREGGTGLGLHIVYNLVTRRLGGRIMLSSAPWRGHDLPHHASAHRAASGNEPAQAAGSSDR